jgi:hypothetical protein
MKMRIGGAKPTLDFLEKQGYKGAEFSFDGFGVSGVLKVDMYLSPFALQMVKRSPHVTSVVKLHK